MGRCGCRRTPLSGEFERRDAPERRHSPLSASRFRRKCHRPVCAMICSAAHAIPCRMRSLPPRLRAEKAADCGHASSRGSARLLAGAAVKSPRARWGNLTSFRRIYELTTPGSQAGRAGSLPRMRSSSKISETRRRGNLSDGTIKHAAADLRHLSARLSTAGRRIEFTGNQKMRSWKIRNWKIIS